MCCIIAAALVIANAFFWPSRSVPQGRRNPHLGVNRDFRKRLIAVMIAAVLVQADRFKIQP
jgi:hypothetical protein